MPPRIDGVPNPDGLNSAAPPFNFTRLGVRVPAVLVAPRVKPGRLLRPSGGKSFEHSSLLATLRRLFPALVQSPLTKREAWCVGSRAAVARSSTAVARAQGGPLCRRL